MNCVIKCRLGNISVCDGLQPITPLYTHFRIHLESEYHEKVRNVARTIFQAISRPTCHPFPLVVSFLVLYIPTLLSLLLDCLPFCFASPHIGSPFHYIVPHTNTAALIFAHRLASCRLTQFSSFACILALHQHIIVIIIIMITIMISLPNQQ